MNCCKFLVLQVADWLADEWNSRFFFLIKAVIWFSPSQRTETSVSQRRRPNISLHRFCCRMRYYMHESLWSLALYIKLKTFYFVCISASLLPGSLQNPDLDICFMISVTALQQSARFTSLDHVKEIMIYFLHEWMSEKHESIPFAANYYHQNPQILPCEATADEIKLIWSLNWQKTDKSSKVQQLNLFSTNK